MGQWNWMRLEKLASAFNYKHKGDLMYLLTTTNDLIFMSHFLGPLNRDRAFSTLYKHKIYILLLIFNSHKKAQ